MGAIAPFAPVLTLPLLKKVKNNDLAEFHLVGGRLEVGWGWLVVFSYTQKIEKFKIFQFFNFRLMLEDPQKFSTSNFFNFLKNKHQNCHSWT